MGDKINVTPREKEFYGQGVQILKLNGEKTIQGLYNRLWDLQQRSAGWGMKAS